MEMSKEAASQISFRVSVPEQSGFGPEGSVTEKKKHLLFGMERRPEFIYK